MTEVERVLGLDPGFGITGWGVVEGRNQLTPLDYGAITTPADMEHAMRLREIRHDVSRLIAKFKPTCIVVEKLFFSRNVTTAGGVFEARGAALVAVGEAELPLLELTPNQIKQAVTGSGRAGKREVMEMVKRILNIPVDIKPDDTADALAGAIAGIFALSAAPLLKAKGVLK